MESLIKKKIKIKENLKPYFNYYKKFLKIYSIFGLKNEGLLIIAIINPYNEKKIY